LISLHTSPLAEAGSGDAGGMNIMVRHTADALARDGHQVTVFTRRADPDSPETIDLPSGVRVRQLNAGPAAPADKRAHEDFIGPFADQLEEHWTRPDLVHSHHWFSGMAAQPLAASHGIPHVQSFHSIAADERRPSPRANPQKGPAAVAARRILPSTPRRSSPSARRKPRRRSHGWQRRPTMC